MVGDGQWAREAWASNRGHQGKAGEANAKAIAAERPLKGDESAWAIGLHRYAVFVGRPHVTTAQIQHGAFSRIGIGH